MAIAKRRRFRRRPYRTLAVGLALAILLVWRLVTGPPIIDPRLPLAEGTHQVVRVVDGDTFIVDADATIRLIGVDTPETVKPMHAVEPYGPEATAFTRAFLADGTVRLSFDRQRHDQYGRFLAYAWVDDRSLNEELLRAGLARFEPQFRYSESMKRRFRQAEQEARQARVGIWSNGRQEEE